MCLLENRHKFKNFFQQVSNFLNSKTMIVTNQTPCQCTVLAKGIAALHAHFNFHAKYMQSASKIYTQRRVSVNNASTVYIVGRNV